MQYFRSLYAKCWLATRHLSKVLDLPTLSVLQRAAYGVVRRPASSDGYISATERSIRSTLGLILGAKDSNAAVGVRDRATLQKAPKGYGRQTGKQTNRLSARYSLVRFIRNSVTNKKAQLTQRERATAVHIWRPSVNQSKLNVDFNSKYS